MDKNKLEEELLRLQNEIELLTLDKNIEILKLEDNIKKNKDKIEQIQREYLEKTKNVQINNNLSNKEIEILKLEKTQKIELLKLEKTKKFTVEELKLIELEMTQNLEKKKLEQELNIDIDKVNDKVSELKGNTNSVIRNKKIQKIIYLLIIFLCIITLLITYKLLANRKTDDTKLQKQINDVVDNTEIEIDPNSVEEKDNNNSKEENNYYKYMNTSLISVDFSELKKKNSDTLGWIQVAGTSINYPFVQTKDNKYYLNHSFNKSKNSMGWVFLDYRNNIENLSRNTIIYAHGLLNNTMFGSLKKVITKSWYTNSSNYTIKISTEKTNSLWQVFSTYKIKPESYYITTTFLNDSSYMDFLDTIKKRSVYDYKTNVEASDNILTLSSCYDDDYRVVLHAKLIKTSTR